MIDYLKYSKGVKYQCKEDFYIQTHIKPEKNIKTDFIELYTDGLLVIRKGFACDGVSGPTCDRPRKKTLLGAFVHDALCKLIRLKLLSQIWKIEVDNLAHKLWLDCYLWSVRADLWRGGLEKFDFYVDPENVKKVYQSGKDRKRN
jgi:hypothetical protein